MGLNFQYYDGLQPKIRAGIINEHECSTQVLFSELGRDFGLELNFDLNLNFHQFSHDNRLNLNSNHKWYQ